MYIFFSIIVFKATNNVEGEMNSSLVICSWPCFQIGKSWISMFYKEGKKLKDTAFHFIALLQMLLQK